MQEQRAQRFSSKIFGAAFLIKIQDLRSLIVIIDERNGSVLSCSISVVFQSITSLIGFYRVSDFGEKLGQEGRSKSPRSVNGGSLQTVNHAVGFIHLFIFDIVASRD